MVGVWGMLKNPVPGRCPHLPGNEAHVDMCLAQKGWPPKKFKNAK